ncbi:DUF805 domain-containing protein [Hyphomonas johnsonii]|jgi:uncharacterized membrane protein YhaH (DUF805 family)|uniref:DUF805 domain-containing protein n=1 Tax=Hyphomonas johnsonii MHS-2 TaxID=1280950 RepID=A0A059FE93_9PROT|nr:DUF805 domain-containing protein [Hyphomonas johnsonii]KCZ88838.1 hypothetical protein HJO_15014 [Hyphomonas johnsonii MHS-2]
MNLFLSPNGRIDQPTYWRGVMILFAISALLSIISAYVSPILGMLGIVFVWPWIAIHVKRFHDADMTGWITIAMVVLAIVVSIVLSMILPALFGVNMAEMQAQMVSDMEDISSSNDPRAMMAFTMEHTKKMSQAQLLPNIVTTALVTGIVGFVMSLFKSTPGPNQYGEPMGAGAGTATFE